MNAIFQKLNYKDQKTIVVLQAPESFAPNLSELAEKATIVTELTAVAEIEFVLAFVTKQHELDHLVPLITAKLKGDAVFWTAYPKKSSKNFTCDFNRDTGWKIMGRFDLEGVRQVAIDADWSALRFRKVDYIKTLTRKFEALSEKGKIKAGQTNK